MKWMAIALLLTGCATYQPKHMVGACDATTEDVFRVFTTAVVKEGFTVKHSDAAAGYIRAESARGMYDGHLIWQAQRTDTGYVLTYNYTNNTGTNVWYVDSDVEKDVTAYWNVRNAVAELCATQFSPEIITGGN